MSKLEILRTDKGHVRRLSAENDGLFTPILLYDQHRTHPNEEHRVGVIELPPDATIEQVFQWLMDRRGWGPGEGATIRFATRHEVDTDTTEGDHAE